MFGLKNINEEKPVEFKCVLVCQNQSNKHTPKHIFAHLDNDDTPHWVNRGCDRIELEDATFWMDLPFDEPYQDCE